MQSDKELVPVNLTKIQGGYVVYMSLRYANLLYLKMFQNLLVQNKRAPLQPRGKYAIQIKTYEDI